MKQGTGKIIDLEDLLVKLEGLSEDKIERIGRRMYSENFLTNAHYGFHLMHDKEKIVFMESRFSHAFFLAGNWQISKEKTSIDTRRVARIRWILPIIQGQIPNTECWLTKESEIEKRIYISFERGYVIWVEMSDKGWWFSSAYTVPNKTIRKYLREGKGKQIWRYK